MARNFLSGEVWSYEVCWVEGDRVWWWHHRRGAFTTSNDTNDACTSQRTAYVMTCYLAAHHRQNSKGNAAPVLGRIIQGIDIWSNVALVAPHFSCINLLFGQMKKCPCMWMFLLYVCMFGCQKVPMHVNVTIICVYVWLSKSAHACECYYYMCVCLAVIRFFIAMLYFLCTVIFWLRNVNCYDYMSRLAK